MPLYGKRQASPQESGHGGKASRSEEPGKLALGDRELRKKQQAKLLEQLPVLTKLLMWNTQNVRQIMGGLMQTYIIRQDGHIYRQMKQYTTAYSEAAAKARAEGKQVQLGPPHLHAYEGLLRGLELEVEAKGGAELLQKVKAFSEIWADVDESTAHAQVLVCKVQKAYKAGDAKLLLWATEQAKVVVCECLKVIGAEQKQSTMPPLGMERILQRALEGLDPEEG